MMAPDQASERVMHVEADQMPVDVKDGDVSGKAVLALMALARAESDADFSVLIDVAANGVARLLFSDPSLAVEDFHLSTERPDDFLPSAIACRLPQPPVQMRFFACSTPDAPDSLWLLLWLQSPARSQDTDTPRFAALANLTGHLLQSHRLLQRQRAQSAVFRDLFDAQPLAMMVTDLAGQSGRMNPAALRLFHLSSAEMAPGEVADALRNMLSVCGNRAELQRLYAGLQQDVQASIQCEWSLPAMTLAVDTHPVADSDRRLWLFHDVTADRHLAQQLQQQEMTDNLTGLPNLLYLQQQVAQAFRKPFDPVMPAMLLMIVIDGLQDIDNHHGHAVAEQVLRTLIARMQNILHEQASLVCIDAGKKFAALLSGRTKKQAKTLAERLVHFLSAVAVPTKAGTLNVAVSIGLVSKKLPEEDVETFMRHAERVLHAARASGRNQMVYYL